MLEDGIKKKLTARLLALVVIISMISALTGCNEPKEQENGVTLVYGQYNQKLSLIHISEPTRRS